MAGLSPSEVGALTAGGLVVVILKVVFDFLKGYLSNGNSNAYTDAYTDKLGEIVDILRDSKTEAKADRTELLAEMRKNHDLTQKVFTEITVQRRVREEVRQERSYGGGDEG